MSNTVIRVENLSKRYIIGHQEQGRYLTMRDTLALNAKRFGKRLLHPLRASSGQPLIGVDKSEEFWALRNISFEVKQGDRIGIIGRNGAGKSTLLKILSRITEPTRGCAKIKGRVSSLLEVGTGFHPELTGRENIFLNGAVLGMTRWDIKKKFDEIVAFAEVEKFLDTPVKRYSSGMYVRLAFAVAAHLEPEILIIDEVLAVGDLAFQKKCMGKMGEVSKEGRTVLFVSHNMQAVRGLCNRGILLSAGRLISDDSTEKVISKYNNEINKYKFSGDADIKNVKFRRGSGTVRFTKIELKDEEGNNIQTIKMGEKVFFHLAYKVNEPVPNLSVSIALRSGMSREIVTSTRHVLSTEKLAPGFEENIILEIPITNIRPREFPLYFWLGNDQSQPFDVVDDIIPPLVVTIGNTKGGADFSLSTGTGYFNIQSTLHRGKYV